MGAPHAPVVRSRRRTNPDAPPISAKENDMTAKLHDDQMTAIREIHQRETPTAKQHFPAVRQAQTKLRQAVLNGADDATIQAKTADVQQLLAQGVDLRVRRLQEIAPLLTAEQ